MQASVLERPIFVRQQSDGLDHVMAYLTFKVVKEVALAVVSSVAYSLLVFFLLNLQGSFFMSWLVFLVMQMVGVGEHASHHQQQCLFSNVEVPVSHEHKARSIIC